jgi:hypothetical protein
MSTTLWHVEVFKIAGDTVRLAVRVNNADSGPFETNNRFVLRILFDQATESRNYKIVPVGPLGEVIDEDKIFDDEWLDEHASEFIKSVEVSNVVNGDVSRASSQAKIEAALIADGKKKDEAGWKELVGERMKAFWAEPKNLPSAVYTIHVTDEKWLAHLKPGQKWGSAAFV